MTPSEFAAAWLAQRPTDSKRIDWTSRELTQLGMSAKRWEVFRRAYVGSASASAALRLGRHPASAVRALRAERDAAAEAALAAALENSPTLRVAVRRTYTRAYWLDVYGGAAREIVARRQARYLIAVAAPGWEFDPRWSTSDVAALVTGMFNTGDYGGMPVLADGLQEAGCDNDEWLALMRDRSQPWFVGAGVLDDLV